MFTSKCPSKYSYEWPKRSGLYLLCQINCKSDDPDKLFYSVKIGKSTNLHQRIRSYSGSNPFASCIDVVYFPPSKIDEMELRYHWAMGKKTKRKNWLRQGNTEWFIIPEEDYKEILEKGFSAIIISEPKQ